ncbi:hypothetical protein Y032_0017g3453 [Ancylostoma ceylanicum]|uniref:Lipid-binding serum glycoprotein N-terminal domain-containing protein n=1 Tax=Ancylostoma ceylanicum TaxID=53326 RepID=A0A016V5A1_9BILA|nr:hypothetical protein Y032_0017g3453 [Ancylostoma ceylanicum]
MRKGLEGIRGTSPIGEWPNSYGTRLLTPKGLVGHGRDRAIDSVHVQRASCYCAYGARHESYILRIYGKSQLCDLQQSLVKYRVWDGKVDHFSVPQSGVSFMDMDNGVHLSIKNVQFHASVRGRVELGKKIFGKWVRIARMSGDIKASSDNAGMDIKLVWDDFKFTPSATMDSNVHISFTHNLKRYLNFLRGRVQSTVTSKVNSEVPKMLIKAVEEKVNPRLQKLKQKIIDMGITEYGIEWKVQNNTLRVILRPKSRIGSPTTVSPMDKMLCIDANIVEAIQPLIRQKRKSFFKRLRDKIRGKKKHHDPPPPPPPPPPPKPTGFDFTCVDPKFECQGLACSYCTDVDVNPSSAGPTDNFHNCVPGF